MHTPIPGSVRVVALLVSVALVAAACSSGSTVIAGSDPTPEPSGEPAVAEPTVTPEPTPVPEPDPTPTATPEDIDTGALDSLAAARNRWQAAGITTYSYTYVRACECVETERGPNTVVVVDGEVTEVRDPLGDAVQATSLTIDELFDATERSIRDGQDTANEYDPDLGHPTVVSLDVEAQAVDGGFALTIVDFADVGEARAALARARQRWEEAGPASYSMTYRLSCFCPELKTTVVVEDGVVVAFESDAASPVDTLTINDLFDEIEQAFETGAAKVTATYDPELGYPNDYFIDESLLIADEEHGVTVEGFEAG